MDTVTILRELWRRRILVGVVAAVAILVGLLLSVKVSLPPQGRQYDVGIASGRILVDTPKSQVIDVAPKGSETLGVRASLLANLMTEGGVNAAIAREAGLRPSQLRAGVESEGELPPVLSNAAGDPNAHLLTTRLAINPDGAPLPMIEIEAQAPDEQQAARLASAAVTGLDDYLDSKAAGEQVADAHRLEVTGFGAPQVREETRGLHPLIAIAAALFVFVIGCGAILAFSSLARGWREASEREEPWDGEPAGVASSQPFDRLRSRRPATRRVARRDWRQKLRTAWGRANGPSTPVDEDEPSAAEPQAPPTASEQPHDSVLDRLPASRPGAGSPRRVQRGAGVIPSAGDTP
jgi:hypothetical protein